MTFSAAYNLTKAIEAYQQNNEFIPTIPTIGHLFTVPKEKPKKTDKITAGIDKQYGDDFWNVYYFRVHNVDERVANPEDLELLGKTTIAPADELEFTGKKPSLEQILRDPSKLRQAFSENSLCNYFDTPITAHDITLQASIYLKEQI